MRSPSPTGATPAPLIDDVAGAGGTDFEQVEHLVGDSDPDTALCGVDQTDVAWNLGWPVCQAYLAVAEGRMS